MNFFESVQYLASMELKCTMPGLNVRKFEKRTRR